MGNGAWGGAPRPPEAYPHMTEPAASKRPRCIVIPAVKKSAVIPDQLVKKLAGKTLIDRALETAKKTASGDDIVVITDSDEIRLICMRAGVRYDYNPAHAIRSLDIVASLREALERLADQYDRIVIYRASSPLITAEDIEDAWGRFLKAGSDCLVTVKSVRHRLWEERGGTIDALLFNDEEQTAYVETKALFMLQSSVFNGRTHRALRTVPYFLHDRGIEINSYQDWWLCEKILQSRHIVFVVAGYPAIGFGHVYRCLMLANEIADHRVTFLCTQDSEAGATQVAARDYHTRIQQTGDLAADVLRLRPDLVVNDILNTEAPYIAALKERGVPVANFEDEGPGAALADLVVNALYEEGKTADPRFLYGYKHFCLRDEFLNARQNIFRPKARRMLVTFGGTDHSDYTGKTLEALFPSCAERGVEIAVVTGPGYAHKERLTAQVAACNALLSAPLVTFTHATNVMSRMMEDVDFAVCSAGRTVYELAHMRIPAIVLSHHAREDMHTFARPRNGFGYLGVQSDYHAQDVRAAFFRMLDPDYRHEMFQRMSRFDFRKNKAQVVRRILALLDEGQKEMPPREDGRAESA